MFYTLKRKLYRWRFYQASKAILSTPPLPADGRNVRILSSVCHDDLFMYLVAVKSYYRFAPYGRVTILDDGTLTRSDIRLLEEHVNPSDIIPLDDVPYRGGRKGVRWGILLTMAELAADNFVIQLDSDTITVRDMPQVDEAVDGNRSFTLGTAMGTRIEPVAQTVAAMKDFDNDHVQTVAEQNFDKLPDAENLRYVRGNSGLVGLARGAFSRERAESFLEDMTTAIGPKWLERGSFQVSSNFAVANSPDAFVLPLSEYRYYHPREDLSGARFIHYIGTFRFVDNAYYDGARAAVQALAAR